MYTHVYMYILEKVVHFNNRFSIVKINILHGNGEIMIASYIFKVHTIQL